MKYISPQTHIWEPVSTRTFSHREETGTLLDSIKEDASAIWFLGDLFDYWYEYKYVVPKGMYVFWGNWPS